MMNEQATDPPAEPQPAKKSSASMVRIGLVLLVLTGLTAILAFKLSHLFSGDEKVADKPRSRDKLGVRVEEGDLRTGPGPAAGNEEPPVVEDDPSRDGWDTEVFSQAAQDQLKLLAKKLLSDPMKKDMIEKLLAPGFSGHALRPKDRTRVYEDNGLEVFRPGGQMTDESPNSTSELDTAEWLESSAEFSRLFADARETHFEVKVFRVSKLADGHSTVVRFQASALKESVHMQVTAVWHCRWAETASDSVPRLIGIEIRDYEEVIRRGDVLSLFTDCTRSVIGGNESYQRQFVPGYESWLRRTPKMFVINLASDHSIVVGDVNGDGRDDVFVCEPETLPNRLYIHNRDGTLTDVSAAAGVDWLDLTQGALLVDLDNDGDQDLIVGVFGTVLLMENDGIGKFAVRAEAPGTPQAHAMTAADFDQDGMVDIYICSYGNQERKLDEHPIPIPYYNATNGGRNVLLRNEGNWQFKDVTRDVGLDVANNRWSLAASWEDYDNDGDPDLYVANDYGRNCLYRNDGGKFTNVALEAGVEDTGSGMSVSWGDYNRDGLLDLYISNMFSTAGSRITYQQQFKPNISAMEKSLLQRMAKGNTLYVNAGDGTFRDVSHESAVAMARWAWGAPFVDINNDGWEDLIVANGNITRDDERDL